MMGFSGRNTEETIEITHRLKKIPALLLHHEVNGIEVNSALEAMGEI
jgi:hypothetical protein